MSSARLRDSPAKAALRALYRAALDLRTRLGGAAMGADGTPRPYYGGARAGHAGGPRVKIAKLAAVFPEHRWRYNLVYVLSNAPYLTRSALERLHGRGVAIVCNQDGVFYPAWYGGDWQAENRRMAAAYHLADHVFHQSEFCRRAAERFLGARAGPSEVLYNAVDTAHFTPARRGGARGGPVTFLVAGKVQAQQAYRLEATVAGLAAALHQGLNARLVVAGAIDGGARAGAAALAERLGVAGRVAFRGPYPQKDAPALFAAADGFVNLNHNDACPTSVIEAMAAGVPVIFARSGGVPELVGEEAGIGIATGDSWHEVLVPAADAVADAMLRLAEGRVAMGEAARRRAVERFDLAPWLERHRQVFRRLLDRCHG